MPRRNQQSKQKRKAMPLPRFSPKDQPPADHPRCPVTGKLSFNSMESAEKALVRIVLRTPSRAYRVYQCQFPDCGKWHHTSKPRRDDGRAA
jgi:hypothetical protein